MWRAGSAKQGQLALIILSSLEHEQVRSTLRALAVWVTRHNRQIWRVLSPSATGAIMPLVQIKADSHIACRAHAAPMLFPCHAAKGLECVFPI